MRPQTTFIAILISLAPWVNAQSATSGPDFQIVSSGYAAPRVRPTLVWLDENRVLFTGGPLSAAAKAHYPDSGEAAKWANPWTFVWDTARGIVERISDWNTVCYSPTYVRQYRRPKSDPTNGFYRLGPPGRELELDAASMNKLLSEERRQGRIYRNEFDCQNYSSSDLTPNVPKDRLVVLLRAGDGFLDVGARDPEDLSTEMNVGQVVRWYHPKAQAGMKLEMPLAFDFGLHRPHYSVYADEYAIVPASRQATSRTGRTEQVYYVLRAKPLSAERASLPTFAPSSGIAQGRIERAKTGMVFSGSAHPWQEWAGIYQLASGKVTRIERGSISSFTVAPNGCKVVYAINARNTEMASPFEVKFAELCTK